MIPVGNRENPVARTEHVGRGQYVMVHIDAFCSGAPVSGGFCGLSPRDSSSAPTPATPADFKNSRREIALG